jgi:serine/threonine protein kinase
METLNYYTGYRDIYDYYEMYKVIGKGHFGEVRFATDKKSKESNQPNQYHH